MRPNRRPRARSVWMTATTRKTKPARRRKVRYGHDPNRRVARYRPTGEAALMDHFNYRDGALHAEDVPLADIAARFGTPIYVYSAATIRRHYRVFAEALAGLDHRICYAVKANSNLGV